MTLAISAVAAAWSPTKWKTSCANRGVERIVGERKLLGRPDAHVDACKLHPALLDERLRGVRGRHEIRADELGEHVCQRTCAAADVDHSLAGDDAGGSRELVRKGAAVPPHEALVARERPGRSQDRARSAGVLTFTSEGRVDPHPADVERRDRVPERERVGRERSLERGQRAPAIGARQGAGLRNGHVEACCGKRLQHRRRHAGRVHGKHHAEIVTGCAQPGDDAGDRRADLCAVVQKRERQVEQVRDLADGDPLVAEGERLPADLGQRPAVETSERLRRAEAGARPADEQNAGQTLIRHGSV